MKLKKDQKNMIWGAVIAIIALAFVPASLNPVNYIKDFVGGFNV